jgi:hypothetical protein
VTAADDLGRRHRGALYLLVGIGAVVLVTVVVTAIVRGRDHASPTSTVAVLMNDAACVTGRSGADGAPPTVAGHVVVWRGRDTPAATVSRLREFGGVRVGLLLGARVAITGAGRAAVCAHYTDAAERAFAAFRSAYG